MNFFDYTLLLQEIQDITTLSKLKQLMTAYYTKADPYRNSNMFASYNIKSKVVAENAKKYLDLFKAVKARYLELGGNAKKLPAYTQRTTIMVDMRMSLDDAIAWIASKEAQR